MAAQGSNQHFHSNPHPAHDTALRYRKSRFLTFIFSALPGLNYMYLGLMKRGLFFMTSFFALIVIIKEIGISFLSFGIFMLICFCLFDSFRIRRQLVDGFDVPDGISDVLSFYKQNKKPILLIMLIVIGIATLRRMTGFFTVTFLESFTFMSILGVAWNFASFILWLIIIIAVCYIIAKIVSRNNKDDN